MNNSMINSSVTMRSLQQKLDMVANNLANLNTVGYKRQDASFQDVLTSVKQQPGGFEKQGRLSPLGYNQGWGARLVQAQLNMAQGSLKPTGESLDLAIEGDGLFEINNVVRDANNSLTTQTAWTRNGSFQLSQSTDPADPDLFLMTKDGQYVMGTDDSPIRLPANSSVNIESDGTIFASDEADKSAAPIEVGQIKMVRVLRPQLLQQLGDNMYSVPANAANREDILQTVDTGNNAVDPISVRQGFLEQSNVTLADEMTDLLQVQKAFQLNSRAVSSSDTMMGIANNLRNG
ncbi:flagellar hook-basal body protein [Paenibacillus doosanensis]|uniref:flagellar hook-basal body protein n=1 Tax=Paenibacillus doosanensis TaxID=1229154 RepID=UPI00217F6BDB|nr:flagellar hook-basal body protein [Paenibacillus doosanensis]MCS7459977.1 flagellar hook-basal body protein [Paenibacillus doosanensis]